MSIAKRLQSLNVSPDTMVTLSYSEGADVFVHNESEIETAISETDVVQTFSSLVATPGLNVFSMYGDNILQELRDEGHLDEYERGTFEFEQFISDVIAENIYDFDFIDRTVEKYDHKRGFCTLTAEVQIPAADLINNEPFLMGWKISVPADNGTLNFDV
mgnify:FL=1